MVLMIVHNVGFFFARFADEVFNIVAYDTSMNLSRCKDYKRFTDHDGIAQVVERRWAIN